jgi:hypothetical protein
MMAKYQPKDNRDTHEEREPDQKTSRSGLMLRGRQLMLRVYGGSGFIFHPDLLAPEFVAL